MGGMQRTRLSASSWFPAPDSSAAGCGASRLSFRLLGAGRHALCNSEVSGSPLGGLVSSLVASYSHVAGYPVESVSPPLRGQALQGAQDGGDEAHVVLGVQVLKRVHAAPTGSQCV